jgi:hypothetical protein
MRRAISLAVLVLVPGSMRAQTLAQRVGAVGEGTVRMSFAARPGTCGNGDNGVSIRSSNDEWEPDCGPSMVRVALRISGHQVRSVKTYVGGRWRSDSSVTDLGTVSVHEAAPYFISLAERDGEEGVGRDAILPSLLADSVTIWPSLVRLARNPHLQQEVRGQAVFWLSQAAGAGAGHALDSIASDSGGSREVRKQAIFALAQRADNEGVPALIRIARSNGDSELRKSALFWLGQSDDARAIDLFEELLR